MNILDFFLNRPELPASPRFSLIPFKWNRRLPEPIPKIGSSWNTNVTIKDPSGRLTGGYDENLVSDIMRAARAAGEDPETAVAMSLQETRLGKTWPQNPMSLWNISAGRGKLKNRFSAPKNSNSTKEPAAYIRQGIIDDSMQRWKDNKRYAKVPSHDTELGIQAFNGMGWLPPNLYGVKERLHGSTDRPYAKAVESIRTNIVKPNEDIQRILAHILGK